MKQLSQQSVSQLATAMNGASSNRPVYENSSIGIDKETTLSRNSSLVNWNECKNIIPSKVSQILENKTDPLSERAKNNFDDTSKTSNLNVLVKTEKHNIVDTTKYPIKNNTLLKGENILLSKDSFGINLTAEQQEKKLKYESEMALLKEKKEELKNYLAAWKKESKSNFDNLSETMFAIKKAIGYPEKKKKDDSDKAFQFSGDDNKEKNNAEKEILIYDGSIRNKAEDFNIGVKVIQSISANEEVKRMAQSISIEKKEVDVNLNTQLDLNFDLNINFNTDSNASKNLNGKEIELGKMLLKAAETNGESLVAILGSNEDQNFATSFPFQKEQKKEEVECAKVVESISAYENSKSNIEIPDPKLSEKKFEMLPEVMKLSNVANELESELLKDFDYMFNF
ncbi:hypothetical protein HK099_002919 [Clydaea vesicula]|uniref:Uncharacterized protein n=1 Tax=Clydaea vesicula TaxID=447962 RepID=A0AAD5U790_9FUNG|nr:hypothetical protein HK099_002919 [Clydaea vesicula]